MKRKLSSKLLFMNIAVVAAALAIIALLLPQLISGYIFSQREREMLAQSSELARLTGQYLEGQIDEESFLQLLASLDSFLEARIWVVARDGEVIRASYGERPFRRGPRLRLSEEHTRQLARGETVAVRRFHPHFEQVMLSVGVPLLSGLDDEPPGSIFLHAPVTEIRSTINNLLRFVLYSGLAAVALASLLGYLFSLRLSRPLIEMTEAANQMARGRYASRIRHRSEDELGQLAGSLNHLAGQLEETINALNREKLKFQSMVAAMLEGVVGVNSSGELTYVNDAARQMLGVENDAAGKPIGDVFHAEELAAPFTETLRRGKPENAIVHLAGSTYSVRVSPVEDEDGGAPGAVGLIHDISEAERLEKMRREFIANVSHELRTPLTAVSGFAEALLDGTAAPERSTRYLETIRSEAGRLNRLIDDLLDLSRFQAGPPELRRENFSLQEAASALAAQLKPRLEEKGISLAVKIPASIQVTGDRDRIHQVLLNLMENALRFSPRGESILLSAAELAGGKVAVNVRDSGPGIPEAELAHIWERFYRVEKSRDRKRGGTGLGLAIVKEIIEAHGETITVHSTSGRGTTFSFTLPSA